MTAEFFFSDRTGEPEPRVLEEVTPEAWSGLVTLIHSRLGDGSLAMAFPVHGCPEAPAAILGTNVEGFYRMLVTLIPQLRKPAQGLLPSRPVLDVERPPPTSAALDVVDFVMQQVAKPVRRVQDDWHKHEHLVFDESSTDRGQRQFHDDVELILSRNGIAFTFDSYWRVGRLGPPEARQFLSDFAPRTGDPELDAKLADAHARFMSRDTKDREDALEKLWDAFERLKTLEGGKDKKESIGRLIDRATAAPELRKRLDTECNELTEIGNAFHIRHFEHDKETVGSAEAVDYLFTRLAALIAFLLRQTGRM